MVGAEFGLLVGTAPEMTDLYSLDLQEGLAVRSETEERGEGERGKGGKVGREEMEANSPHF